MTLLYLDVYLMKNNCQKRDQVSTLFNSYARNLTIGNNIIYYFDIHEEDVIKTLGIQITLLKLLIIEEHKIYAPLTTNTSQKLILNHRLFVYEFSTKNSFRGDGYIFQRCADAFF